MLFKPICVLVVAWTGKDQAWVYYLSGRYVTWAQPTDTLKAHRIVTQEEYSRWSKIAIHWHHCRDTYFGEYNLPWEWWRKWPEWSKAKKNQLLEANRRIKFWYKDVPFLMTVVKPKPGTSKSIHESAKVDIWAWGLKFTQLVGDRTWPQRARHKAWSRRSMHTISWGRSHSVSPWSQYEHPEWREKVIQSASSTHTQKR
jgi:hypothetical protein